MVHSVRCQWTEIAGILALGFCATCDRRCYCRQWALRSGMHGIVGEGRRMQCVCECLLPSWQQRWCCGAWCRFWGGWVVTLAPLVCLLPSHLLRLGGCDSRTSRSHTVSVAHSLCFWCVSGSSIPDLVTESVTVLWPSRLGKVAREKEEVGTGSVRLRGSNARSFLHERYGLRRYCLRSSNSPGVEWRSLIYDVTDILVEDGLVQKVTRKCLEEAPFTRTPGYEWAPVDSCVSTAHEDGTAIRVNRVLVRRMLQLVLSRWGVSTRHVEDVVHCHQR